MTTASAMSQHSVVRGGFSRAADNAYSFICIVIFTAATG